MIGSVVLDIFVIFQEKWILKLIMTYLCEFLDKISIYCFVDVRTFTFRLKRNSTNNSFLDPYHELYINKLSEVYSYLFHLKVSRGEAELICRRQYFWVLYWLTLWMYPSKPLPGYTIVMAYTTYRTIEYKA